MNKWILYNILVGFAVYWTSNLILWFPWSISTVLGMTLMLTISPIIWTNEFWDFDINYSLLN